MAAVGSQGNVYCVQSNCFGYGRFSEREPSNVPLQIAKVIAAMQNVEQQNGAKSEFIRLMTEDDRLFLTPLRVVVINKNILSRVIHFIVRIFAILFCRTKKYFLVKSPLNKNEIWRINKRENIEDTVIALRKLPRSIEFINLLIKFIPDLLASLSDQKNDLKQIQDHTKFTKEEKVIKALVFAKYKLFEQLAKPQTMAERIEALEQFLPYHTAAIEVNFLDFSGGLTEVAETNINQQHSWSLTGVCK